MRGGMSDTAAWFWNESVCSLWGIRPVSLSFAGGYRSYAGSCAAIVGEPAMSIGSTSLAMPIDMGLTD